MILEIDPRSPVPPYEQIRDQVATMAATGVLPEGARMPPIRQLAADLGLANGTVARAYRELERDGVLEPNGRHGSFVRAVSTAPDSTAVRRLAQLATTFAVGAHQLRVQPQVAQDAVRQALSEIKHPARGAPGQ